MNVITGRPADSDPMRAALAIGVDAILLHDMSLGEPIRAVEMIGGRAVTEASGRMPADTATAVAATGVELISVGWITHSAPVLDVGMDLVVRRRSTTLVVR